MSTLLSYLPSLIWIYMSLDFKQILETLEEAAKEDGKVTQEEENFLAALRKDIELFQQSLSYATQDDYISDDQLHDLIILRDKLLTDSLQFNTNSEDVNKLVTNLYDKINDLMIPGMDKEDMVDK